MSRDPRFNLSPKMLYASGDRFIEDGYPLNDAVADYLTMHPEANEAAVKAEMQELDRGPCTEPGAT